MRRAGVRRATALALALAVGLGAGVVGAGCSRGSDTEAFCEQVAQAPTLASVLIDLDNADPDVVEARSKEAVDAFRDLERAAPREIRGDVARISRFVAQVLEVVQEHPGDPAAVRRELNGMRSEASGLAAAGLRVTAYAGDECDIDLSDLDGSEPSGTPTTTTAPATTTEP